LDYAVFLGTSAASAKEVRAFQLSTFLEAWAERLGTVLWKANTNLTLRRNIVGGVVNVFGLVAYYAGYAYVGWRAAKGFASVGDVVLLAGLLQRTRSEVQGIFSRVSRSVEDAVQLGDLFEFLRLEPRLRGTRAVIPGPRCTKDGLTVDRVSFSYEGTDGHILDRCSFRLESGMRLALVGENGSGKTTIVKLLTRLYDPIEGRILLDGVDLRDYDLKTVRKHIVPMFQDFVRYDLTVRQNLCIGLPEKSFSDGELWRALELSNARKVVERLPNGINQLLGRRFEGGVELSGGQWQRIAMARTWLRDAKVLVLDEPAAALDSWGERQFQTSLSRLTTGRMALLISHRFSTIRLADQIIVLSKGRIVENGTHDHLISVAGPYSELFEMQASGYR
jgi:ATP-binding cassette subfamily B protein